MRLTRISCDRALDQESVRVLELRDRQKIFCLQRYMKNQRFPPLEPVRH